MFGGRFAISDVRRENRRCPVELAAETLAETAGRFRLNAELPIPFDGWGRMEVDLLCAPSRIAIELDGGQHLGDPDAYRRDRRKDALLQENGYRVLRFLAKDVGNQDARL